VRGTLLALVLISCSTVACGSDAIHDTASAPVATVPAKQYLVRKFRGNAVGTVLVAGQLCSESHIDLPT